METCPVCKQEVQHQDGYPYCSEYCATVPQKKRDEFLAAKPGDFCVYPCPGCGIPIEDEWNPQDSGCMCSDCFKKARLKQKTDLLKEALPFLPAELKARVEEALKS